VKVASTATRGEVARERVRWILENHQPEPLEKAKQDELTRILAAAGKELG